MFPKMLLISTMNMAFRHTLRSPVCRLINPLSQHLCTKVPPSADKPAAQSSLISEDTKDPEDPSNWPGLPTRRLTNNQKRYLLLAFKHKRIAECPDVLTVTQIDRLYQRARITVNIMVGLLVAILCYVNIGIGKKRAARGDSVEQVNKEWHRTYKEEHLAKEAAKLADSAPSH